MKKLILAVWLILISCVCFSQNPLPRSSSTVTAVDQRNWSVMNFKIPVMVTDTIGALKGGIDSIGLIIWTKASSQLWLRDTVPTGGHKWTPFFSGAQIPYVDTLYYRPGVTTDSLFYKKDGTEYLHYVVDLITYGVLSGGQVTSTSNTYCKDVATVNFRINRKRYTAQGVDSICLPTCDSLPRIDVFYADTLGNIGVITGTPDSVPIHPQVDQTWQVELSFVQVQCDTSGPAFTFPNFIYWGIGNIPYGHQYFIYDSVNHRYEVNARAFLGVPGTTKSSVVGDASVDGDIYIKAGNANNRSIRFGTQFLVNQNTQSAIVYDANAKRFTFGGVVSGLSHNINNGINSVSIMDSGQAHSSFFGTQEAFSFGVFSSRKGVLFPRLNTAQMNSSTSRFANAWPGIVLYNTDSAALCYWNGSVWRKIGSSSSSSTGVDSLFYKPGVNLDTFAYSKNGVDYDWYVNVVQNGLISGGVVTWTGTGFDYYVTSALYRKNGVLYTSPDTVVTLPPLTDIDSARTDLFIANTSSQATSITGVESANPVVPQSDPTTDVVLTAITILPGQTSGLVDTAIIYDEINAPPEWTGGASGVVVNFLNTTNVYRGTKSVNVGAINNGDVIGWKYTSPVNRLDKAGISLFVKLKAVMPANNNISISFFIGGIAATNQVIIPLNKTNITSYQGISIGTGSFTWSNNFFDSVRINYTGGGAGISGMYLDFIYLQNQIPTGGGTGTLTGITATNNWGQTWTITNPTTAPNLNLALDTVSHFSTVWLTNQKVASVTGIWPILVDDSDPQNPIISNADSSTFKYIITQHPIMADSLNDSTSLLSFDTTGGGIEMNSIHGYGWLLQRFPTLDALYDIFISYDSAGAMFQDTTYVSGDTLYGYKNGNPFFVAKLGVGGTDSLADGKVWIGDATGLAQERTMSGDVTVSNTGVTAIGTNKVTDVMIRQSAGTSIIGRALNSTGNVADIAGTTDQVLRVNSSGTALAFGSIDLSKSGTVGSSILPIANGGIGAATVAAYTNFGNRTASTAAPTFFTNPFIDSLKRSSDTVYGRINGSWVFQHKDSTGGGGANVDSLVIHYNATARGLYTAYLPTVGTYGTGGSNVNGFNTLFGIFTAQNSTGYSPVNLTAVGYAALQFNTTGTSNTGIGQSSIAQNLTGNNNTAVGSGTLNGNASFSDATAVGYLAGGANKVNYTTAFGSGALAANTTGAENEAIGNGALQLNTTGAANLAVGRQSMYNNNANYNTGLGYGTLYTNSAGTSNLAVGINAMFTQASGSYNIAIGPWVQMANTSGSQQLNIGNVIYGTGMYGTASNSSTPVAGGSIGIGVVPVASALLDLTSTTKGLLIPRGTNTNMNAIGTPATGLMFWNTTDSSLYHYRGTTGGWQTFLNSAGVNDGRIVFSANGSVKDTTTLLYNRSNGYVGIGATTTPTSTLYLTGGNGFPSGNGSEIFSSSGWTANSGWSGSYPTFTHAAAGGTATITRTGAALASTYYIMLFTVSGRTAGSFGITWGGVSAFGIGLTNGTYGFTPLTTSTGTLSITPTTDFDGSITFTSLKVQTDNSVPIQTWISTTTTNSVGGQSALELRYSAMTGLGIGSGALAKQGWTGAGNGGGTGNIAIGYTNMGLSTGSYWNTSIGDGAATSLSTGISNVIMGRATGTSLTTGSGNTIIGSGANGPSTANGVVLVGSSSIGNASGATAVGVGITTLGQYSSYFGTLGYGSGLFNSTGAQNTFVGAFSNQLGSNVSTGANMASLGYASLDGNTGSNNVGVGMNAGAGCGTCNSGLGLRKYNSGSYNTYAGYQSGKLSTSTQSGSGSFYAGANAPVLDSTGSNQIVIAVGGASAFPAIVKFSTDNYLLNIAETAAPTVTASAALEINGTAKGLLIMRLTTTQRDAISSPATGLVVFNSTTNTYDIYDGTRWETMVNGLNGSATLDFGSTAAGTSSELTITVTGAADGDIVIVSPPNSAYSANSFYSARVSATNTVSVAFNNYQAVGAIDPASATFKVWVKKN